VIEIFQSRGPPLRISVEAKGGKGTISHKELHQSTVNRHMKHEGCTKAIAIAREYQTEGREGDSGLVMEAKDLLPLITTDGIAELLRLHSQRPFTYDKIETILTTWTPPDELVSFIKKTWEEMPKLGLMKLILTVAHDMMNKGSVNQLEVGMMLIDPRIIAKGLLKEDVIRVLYAIQTTTEMIVILNEKDYEFKLLQSPDTILKALSMDPAPE
jgi:hypothetical protein